MNITSFRSINIHADIIRVNNCITLCWSIVQSYIKSIYNRDLNDSLGPTNVLKEFDSLFVWSQNDLTHGMSSLIDKQLRYQCCGS